MNTTTTTTIDRSRYPKSDSQKSKVYAAERATCWTPKPGVSGWAAKTQLTPEQAEEYAQRAYHWIMSKRDPVRRYDRPIDFKHSRGHGGAWANRSRHQMMLTSCREPWLLLHEVAHLVRPSAAPKFDGDYRSHGWAFCDHYLALVQHFLGVDNADALRAAMKENNVRFRPKRKRSQNVKPPTPPKREKATHVYIARYVPTTARASDAHVAKYATSEHTYVYTESYMKIVPLERWREGFHRGKPLYRVSKESLLKSMDRIHYEKPGDDQQFRILRVPREAVERDAGVELPPDFWDALDAVS